MLKVNNPILTNVDLLKIKNMKQDGFKIAEIPTIYYVLQSGKSNGLPVYRSRSCNP